MPSALKEARLMTGRTQQELVDELKADGVKIDTYALSRLESGSTFPSPVQAEALTRHLQVPLSRLFPEIEQFITGTTKTASTAEIALRCLSAGYLHAAELLHEKENEHE